MRLKINLHFLIVLFFCINNVLSAQMLKLKYDADTFWWFGVINHGHLMPLNEDYKVNLYGNIYGNQAQPLLLSNQGDVIWSDQPPRFEFNREQLIIEADGIIYHDKPGNTLREAYSFASINYFPPSGKIPDADLFRQPQYNTWIELMYDQNQADILQYAHSVIENGFPPGVLMIDDNWQEDYGKWDFHPGRFINAHMMIDSLHQMGFKVMLWICPFISADSDVYRQLNYEGLLLRDSTSHSAIVRWWNGASALLDFSNPKAVEWFGKQLAALVTHYQIDGFKLDGGDPEYYRNVRAFKDISPNQHTELFGIFGLKYPLNEYRAMWKRGGQPLAQRLRDKQHNWEDLKKLIPHIILQGLCGYPFSCPDMIGGGEFSSFLNLKTIDQELIVRSAQAHALMPMMQFSVAPWRVLNQDNLKAVKEAIHIREKFVDYILEQAHVSAQTNEPLVRSLEYEFPHQGYQDIQDQFLLGQNLMVAPVLEKGKSTKQVHIPPGLWKDSKGKLYPGPEEIEIDITISSLPYFEKSN